MILCNPILICIVSELQNVKPLHGPESANQLCIVSYHSHSFLLVHISQEQDYKVAEKVLHCNILLMAGKKEIQKYLRTKLLAFVILCRCD